MSENEHNSPPADKLEVRDSSAYVDDELLDISGPPPSLRYGLFTLLVIAMSVWMLVWFYPEFSYLLQGLGDPQPLGDAADIDMESLRDNSYVSVEGIPWVTKTIVFQDGIKWFSMSDTTKKLFPMMGQPKLLVRWPVPDKDKVYRDPRSNPSAPALPGYFEGHLVRYENFNKRYKHIWAYMKQELNFEVTPGSWVLVDGETPLEKIWVVFIYLLLLVTIVVNAYKLHGFWIAWKA